MKVGVDISQSAHTGGVGTYTNNLTEELVKLRSFEYSFLYASLRKKYQGSLSNVKKIPIPPTIFEVLCNQLRVFSIDSVMPGLDLFHSSDWTQPKTKAKKVTTYHDLIPLKFPELSHPKIVAVQKRRLKIVDKEINGIIAVSENTKKDLIELSTIPAEKIEVIYEGVSSIFKPRSSEEVARFKEKKSLPEKFILAIGGIGKRKNLERIKEACIDMNLVIAGLDVAAPTEEDMNLLYASSQLLLYAPLYEGFGLPILEAFSTGIPVIASNTSSMPEIGGDGAEYVNPEDVGNMKKKINEVINNNSLKDEMVKKGYEISKKFTWEKAARETAEFYNKVLNK